MRSNDEQQYEQSETTRHWNKGLACKMRLKQTTLFNQIEMELNPGGNHHEVRLMDEDEQGRLYHQ